eukprot:7277655-Alexandrium_andersonii.AAC.1
MCTHEVLHQSLYMAAKSFLKPASVEAMLLGVADGAESCLLTRRRAEKRLRVSKLAQLLKQN